MPTAAQKTCLRCGREVSQVKRVKDNAGNYYCHPCWASDATRQSMKHMPNGVAAVSSPVQIAGGQNHEAVDPDKLSTGERRLIFGGVLVGLLIVSLVVYFLIGRTWWEDHHRQAILSLKENAETLVRQGKLSDARLQYDQLFSLVGNHTIRSDDLQDSIKTAHDEADKAATEQKAQTQAAEVARIQQHSTKDADALHSFLVASHDYIAACKNVQAAYPRFSQSSKALLSSGDTKEYMDSREQLMAAIETLFAPAKLVQDAHDHLPPDLTGILDNSRTVGDIVLATSHDVLHFEDVHVKIYSDQLSKEMNSLAGKRVNDNADPATANFSTMLKSIMEATSTTITTVNQFAPQFASQLEHEMAQNLAAKQRDQAAAQQAADTAAQKKTEDATAADADAARKAAEQAQHAADLDLANLMYKRIVEERTVIGLSRLKITNYQNAMRFRQHGKLDDSNDALQEAQNCIRDISTCIDRVNEFSDSINKADAARVEAARQILLAAPECTDDLRPYAKDDLYWDKETQKCSEEFDRITKSSQ